MFSNATKKQKMKLVGSAVSTALVGVFVVLVLLIYFHSASGWFSNNRSTHGSGMAIGVEAFNAEAEYTVFVYDAKLQSVRYTGAGLTDSPKLDDLKMQIHDIIFRQRNRYTPAVVHIHLRNIKDGYRNGGNLSIKLSRDDSDAYVTNNGAISLSKKTTSILRFTLVNNHELSSHLWLCVDRDPSVAATADEIYFNIDETLYGKIVTDEDYSDTPELTVDSKVFTAVTTGAGQAITDVTKEQSITLTVPYTASDVVNGEMDLFLYMTYDNELVGYIERESGLDAGSTTIGKVTTLKNDLTGLLIAFSID